MVRLSHERKKLSSSTRLAFFISSKSVKKQGKKYIMYFLVIQSTYDVVRVGFFNDFQISPDQKVIQKFHVARDLVRSIQELLQAHNLTFTDLAFIGVSRGPAPFNALRSVLATINGLAFATKIPLIGVDAIKALHTSSDAPQTVVFLNAFNNEVYYAYTKRAQLTIGVANIHEILPVILLDIPHGEITFLGNGTALFTESIMATFGTHANIPTPIISEVPLETLAHICVNKFNKNEMRGQVEPLYLKRAV